MKVRSKKISEQLETLGWSRVGEETMTVVTGVYHEGDPRAALSFHDWYYGPLLVWKKLPAVRMRRPAGVTRRQERKIFQCLITWNKYLELCDDEQDEDLAQSLAKIAEKAIMTAYKIVAR